MKKLVLGLCFILCSSTAFADVKDVVKSEDGEVVVTTYTTPCKDASILAFAAQSGAPKEALEKMLDAQAEFKGETAKQVGSSKLKACVFYIPGSDSFLIVDEHGDLGGPIPVKK